MLRTFWLSLMFVGISFSAGAECMGPYPPSMVRAFNDNCGKDARMLPFCACLMDDIQQNIPLADFIEIGNSPGGINNDPRFIKASTKCSTLLNGGKSATPAASSPAGSSGSTSTANTGKTR